MSGIRLDVLGPLEVSVDGQALDLRRGIPRAIMVALILRARELVSAGALADLVSGHHQRSIIASLAMGPIRCCRR